MTARASGSHQPMDGRMENRITPLMATSEAPSLRRHMRPWHVLHACESLDDTRALIEGQLAVGMRPSVVTPDGVTFFADGFRGVQSDRRAPTSLLHAWQDIRQWRKVILDADPCAVYDVVHAHSFTAGMASVRNCPAVVYELLSFIEERAIIASAAGAGPQEQTSGADNSSWLGRSFRVAEQFVFSRAAAVVTRTHSAQAAVVRRGASIENTFVIPEPIACDAPPASPDGDWLASQSVPSGALVVYAPAWTMKLTHERVLTAASHLLLESFAAAGANLLLCAESDPEAVQAASEKCDSLAITGRVRIIQASDRNNAVDSADIIVAGSTITQASGPFVTRVLLSRKALLAADVESNREITPDGCGCLWFTDGDAKDIAHRLTFLANHTDFRGSLAESGRRMLLQTRAPEVIAGKYDEVYRHAVARKKFGGLQTPAVRLKPLDAIS